MKKRTGDLIHSKASTREIRELWKECIVSLKMTGFIYCLGTGGIYFVAGTMRGSLQYSGIAQGNL